MSQPALSRDMIIGVGGGAREHAPAGVTLFILRIGLPPCGRSYESTLVIPAVDWSKDGTFHAAGDLG